jgi:hypothetical protein
LQHNIPHYTRCFGNRNTGNNAYKEDIMLGTIVDEWGKEVKEKLEGSVHELIRK